MKSIEFFENESGNNQDSGWQLLQESVPDRGFEVSLFIKATGGTVAGTLNFYGKSPFGDEHLIHTKTFTTAEVEEVITFAAPFNEIKCKTASVTNGAFYAAANYFQL